MRSGWSSDGAVAERVVDLDEVGRAEPTRAVTQGHHHSVVPEPQQIGPAIAGEIRDEALMLLHAPALVEAEAGQHERRRREAARAVTQGDPHPVVAEPDDVAASLPGQVGQHPRMTRRSTTRPHSARTPPARTPEPRSRRSRHPGRPTPRRRRTRRCLRAGRPSGPRRTAGACPRASPGRSRSRPARTAPSRRRARSVSARRRTATPVPRTRRRTNIPAIPGRGGVAALGTTRGSGCRGRRGT